MYIMLTNSYNLYCALNE